VLSDAPSAATKICARVISPVAASKMGTASPAKSTNSFSPAMCTWRIERCCALANSRYFTQKLVYL